MTVASKVVSQSATPSFQASSVSAITILAANSKRVGATIYNEGSSNLTLHLGSGASSTVYTVILVPNAYYETPFGYTGIITGFWATAAGGNNARVVELS